MLELTEEHFYQVKPGLSDYANNPKQVSTKKKTICYCTFSGRHLLHVFGHLPFCKPDSVCAKISRRVQNIKILFPSENCCGLYCVGNTFSDV